MGRILVAVVVAVRWLLLALKGSLESLPLTLTTKQKTP
jgi:hypothetical protein